jgi:hypothetical protein
MYVGRMVLEGRGNPFWTGILENFEGSKPLAKEGRDLIWELVLNECLFVSTLLKSRGGFTTSGLPVFSGRHGFEQQSNVEILVFGMRAEGWSNWTCCVTWSWRAEHSRLEGTRAKLLPEGLSTPGSMALQAKLLPEGQSAPGSQALQAKLLPEGLSTPGSMALQAKLLPKGQSTPGSMALQAKLLPEGLSTPGSMALKAKLLPEGQSTPGSQALQAKLLPKGMSAPGSKALQAKSLPVGLITPGTKALKAK